MLSRVADAVFWMTRYMERAENVARIVDVSLHLALDRQSDDGHWAALVATTGDEEEFRARYGAPERDKVIEFLVFDASHPNSVYSCLQQARENARSVREIISSEMWQTVNTAYLTVRDAVGSKSAMDAPHALFSLVKQHSAAFIGVTYVTMTHNEAWHFGRLGRLLERADKTSRILDVRSFLAEDEAQGAALLRSASAFEMYRKRHGLIAHDKVVEFLLLDRQFPRSVLYCLTKARRSLSAITGASPGGGSGYEPERMLGRLHAEFEYAVCAEILARGLHEYLDELQAKLNAVGDVMARTFFAPPPGPPPPPSQFPPSTDQ